MKPATLRMVVHAGRDRAAWHAKTTSFAGVAALEIRIGADEVVVFIRPEQVPAARAVAAEINARFA